MPLLIFQKCLKFHSPITASDSEITSNNFEISPPIMLLPKSIQIPYNVPVYECTSAFFVHDQGKCCLVSQISRRDHSFMLAWIKAWSGVGGGGAAKVLTNDRVVYSRASLWKVLLQHTKPWGQLIHWPLTNQWTSKKILDQVRPSGKLPTYAYPNSTLTLTSHLGQNIRVREGVGWKLPKNLNWSVSAFFAVLQLPLHKNRQVSGERTKCT